MSMASPLLETKLHVPRRRRGLVARPRLIERLSRKSESKLTVVSAPAGFGKTTLLAEWLAAVSADGGSTAWLSLDKSDNDPALFWTYLIGGLQTAADGVGGPALSLLQSPPQPPIEAVLATLLNDLGASSNDLVLVLDDYHVIDAGDVQDGMAFLLRHLPPQIHLVIAGRADPALPLARLRGRGELVEIRAADLRFTPEEAAAYLNGVMGLALTARDVAALEERTEGWIAALQLAALSMQGRDDVATSSTTWPRRSCNASPSMSSTSCSDLGPGSAERPNCAMPSPARTVARPSWRRWSEGTCSWSRSTAAAGGIATLSSLPTSCGRACWTSSPTTFLNSTGGRARGTSRTASHPRRSATRWPPGRSSGPRASSSWRSRHFAGAGRRPRSVAGSTLSPTTWSGSGPCSRWASLGR
jgi:hypothetical protein